MAASIPVRPAGFGQGLRRVVQDIGGGTVAATLTIAFSLSYGALMFAGDLAGAFPAGVAMALTTSAVTAIVVALRGTIPFAIAGADSASVAPMAIMIAAASATLPAGLPAEARLATLLALLTATSLLTGLGLWALGRARAAVIVRYVPYPLVAGFMAANGWFVLTAAVHLVTDVPVEVAALGRLAEPLALTKLGAALALAAILTLGVRRWPHPLALPLLLGLGTLAAHAGLAWAGLHGEAARTAGWLFATGPTAEPVAASWHPWRFAAWAPVHWGVLVEALPDMLAVFAVTALAILMSASSLEVAAGEDCDLNRELRAQGQAALLAALLGGFAGSLSISRSLVNRMAGGRGRLSGVACGLVTAAALFFGTGLVALVPKLVLAGLLAFAGGSLLWKWLIAARRELELSEYATVLAMLLVVARYGYATGIGLGVLAGCVIFAVRYARTPTVKHHLSLAERRSRVDRSPDDAVRLSRLGAAVPILQLQGFLFFGSAHGLQQQVKALLPEARAVVLDFKLVSGLDSSTAFSFQKMLQAAARADVLVLFAGLNEACRGELGRAQIFASGSRAEAHADLDQALERCEELLLAEVQVQDRERRDFAGWLAEVLDSREAALALTRATDRIELAPGQPLCRQGEPTEHLLFLDHGRVNVVLDLDSGRRLRLRVMEGRTVLGEMGFFMAAPRSASVLAETPVVVYRLSRAAHAALVNEQPEAGHALARFIICLMGERLKTVNSLVAAYER